MGRVELNWKSKWVEMKRETKGRAKSLTVNTLSLTVNICYTSLPRMVFKLFWSSSPSAKRLLSICRGSSSLPVSSLCHPSLSNGRFRSCLKTHFATLSAMPPKTKERQFGIRSKVFFFESKFRVSLYTLQNQMAKFLLLQVKSCMSECSDMKNTHKGPYM